MWRCGYTSTDFAANALCQNFQHGLLEDIHFELLIVWICDHECKRKTILSANLWNDRAIAGLCNWVLACTENKLTQSRKELSEIIGTCRPPFSGDENKKSSVS